MTGTGTENDPYIVESWAELSSVMEESTNYVKLKENAVIDFNEIYPEGIPGNFDINAHLDGNGGEMRDAYFSADGSRMYFKDVKNLGVVNVLVNKPIGLYSSSAFDTAKMTNCRFSGIVQNGKLIDSYGGEIYNSSFRFKFNGGEFGGSNDPYRIFNYENCQFILSGGNAEGGFAISHFKNCKFKGTIPFVFNPDNCDTCVIDADVYEMSNATGYTHSIANSEKIPSSFTKTGLTKITTAQMHNVDYLQSIGFPVVSG